MIKGIFPQETPGLCQSAAKLGFKILITDLKFKITDPGRKRCQTKDGMKVFIGQRNFPLLSSSGEEKQGNSQAWKFFFRRVLSIFVIDQNVPNQELITLRASSPRLSPSSPNFFPSASLFPVKGSHAFIITPHFYSWMWFGVTLDSLLWKVPVEASSRLNNNRKQ